MYGAYKYFGGASTKNILSDLKAIATGTTNKALLSADCDKDGTTLAGTVAAGWSTTTGGVSLPEDKVLPTAGTLLSKPVDNGSYLLWPLFGTNKVLKSTDGGVTWNPFTLPNSLGSGSAYWYTPLTWNGSLWVLCDPTQSVNYVFTSADGETWTQRSTTTAQQWKQASWSGTLWVLTALNSTQAIATSTDGLTWTYRATALPVAAYWGIHVFANGIWVITQNNVVSSNVTTTTFATSTDGITWTSRSLPVSYYTWTPQYLNGLWLIAGNPSAAQSVIMTSTDGINFTSRAMPQSQTWDIQYADGVYVASSFGAVTTGYVAVSADGITWSQTLTGNGVRRAVFNTTLGLWFTGGVNGSGWTSPDAMNWTARALPLTFSSSQYCENVVLQGVFYCFGGSNQGYYMMSYDGVTWVGKAAATLTNITVTRDSLNVVANTLYSNSTGFSNIASVVSYNGGGNAQCLRALNDDGTTYKKVLLSTADKVVMLMSAEDIGVNTVLNKINNSDNINYAQPLDLANGGIVFFQITKNYLWLLSYRPAATLWGSSTGNGGTAIAEYERGDDWSSAQGYPTHCWLNSATFDTGNYSPRLKSNGALDVTGAQAQLNAFLSNPFPKQAMNASGLAVPPSMNARVSNFSTLIYGVIGGNLCGGVRQTVASYGNNGDEMMLGSTNYIMHAGSTFRLLVPLQ